MSASPLSVCGRRGDYIEPGSLTLALPSLLIGTGRRTPSAPGPRERGLSGFGELSPPSLYDLPEEHGVKQLLLTQVDSDIAQKNRASSFVFTTDHHGQWDRMMKERLRWLIRFSPAQRNSRADSRETEKGDPYLSV